MVQREEFESFVADVESFRDTILDEFSKLKQDLEKLKYNIEELKESIKESGEGVILNQSKLG